ncbi:MAG: DUF2254 domain-containing protein, partial [Flavobacteriales bacterium]
LEGKIAFYPTILSLVGVIFGFFMYYLEDLGISKYFIEHVPWLVINNADTARTILTTFLAGVISIMVFSFSMVMLLLNQASSNFSPRVIPGIISNRRHQFILGIFNASLFYFIITLIVIKPTNDTYQLPGFSVILAIIFMAFCLSAFIYFIHSISQEIQVNRIINKIYMQVENRLTYIISIEKDMFPNFPNSDDWITYNCKKSAYLQDFTLSNINEILKKEDVKAEILQIKGMFVLKDSPLFKVSKKLNGESIKKIYDSCHFGTSEIVEDNYVLGFKQITEIAMKAMSPGINDPGTAINAIDYLTQLFILRMQKLDNSYYFHEGITRIHIKTTSFRNILFYVMAMFRTYTKHDIVIVEKLFYMLKSLFNYGHCVDKEYKTAVSEEINNLYTDAMYELKNDMDIKRIKLLKESIT